MVQIANRQMQLEETVGVMSQEIGTIKQLLERLVVPLALTTARGETIAEEWCAATTCGNAISRRRTNSHQLPRSQAKSTYSTTPNSKRMHAKAGLSRPHNEIVSGLPLRSVAQ